MLCLQAHVAENHPACQFCTTRFFNSDELYSHMRLSHSICTVCRDAARNYRYFRTPVELRDHVFAEHHACTNEACQQACVAFATAEELRAHTAFEHSKRMPRMDRARAYRLELEQPPLQHRGRMALPQAAARPPPQPEPDRRRSPRGYAVDDSAMAGAAGADAAGVVQHQGLVMFDDAEGTVLGRAEYQPAAPQWPGAPGSRQQTPATSFPSLSEAVGTTAPAVPRVAPTPVAPRPPPLVRKQLTCPCGRSKKHVVVREGADPGTMECTAACAAARRKAQLAEAFGRDVGDADTLTPTRAVEWPLDLVVVRTLSDSLRRGGVLIASASASACSNPQNSLSQSCRPAHVSSRVVRVIDAATTS